MAWLAATGNPSRPNKQLICDSQSSIRSSHSQRRCPSGTLKARVGVTCDCWPPKQFNHLHHRSGLSTMSVWRPLVLQVRSLLGWVGFWLVATLAIEPFRWSSKLQALVYHSLPLTTAVIHFDCWPPEQTRHSQSGDLYLTHCFNTRPLEVSVLYFSLGNLGPSSLRLPASQHACLWSLNHMRLCNPCLWQPVHAIAMLWSCSL